jgi:hypothetical protein
MPNCALDPFEVVRVGYDRLSANYRSDDAAQKTTWT